MAGHDIGLTHMAFVIADRPKNIGFYPHGTGMQIIHQREPAIAAAEKVAWLSGLTRSCALAWCRRAPGKDMPLGAFGHPGVACASREKLADNAQMARQEGGCGVHRHR
uniref:VOC family protein n=1 Tax=Erwinia pyrifoliae TaxID=79967 RepID=UPI003F68B610